MLGYSYAGTMALGRAAKSPVTVAAKTGAVTAAKDEVASTDIFQSSGSPMWSLKRKRRRFSKSLLFILLLTPLTRKTVKKLKSTDRTYIVFMTTTVVMETRNRTLFVCAFYFISVATPVDFL